MPLGSTALLAGLQTARTGGLLGRAPGFAIWASCSRRAHPGVETNPKLGFKPDYSIGAGQPEFLDDTGLVAITFKVGSASSWML